MEMVLWLIEHVKSGLQSFFGLLTFQPNSSVLWAASYIGRCLAAALASTHQKPIAGDSRHTQNIQINKVIGENEKCVFYFIEKLNRLFGQPNTMLKYSLFTWSNRMLGFAWFSRKVISYYLGRKIEHRWKTQGPWAESGPPTLFLPVAASSLPLVKE